MSEAKHFWIESEHPLAEKRLMTSCFGVNNITMVGLIHELVPEVKTQSELDYIVRLLNHMVSANASFLSLAEKCEISGIETKNWYARSQYDHIHIIIHLELLDEHIKGDIDWCVQLEYEYATPGKRDEDERNFLMKMKKSFYDFSNLEGTRIRRDSRSFEEYTGYYREMMDKIVEPYLKESGND